MNLNFRQFMPPTNLMFLFCIMVALIFLPAIGSADERSGIERVRQSIENNFPNFPIDQLEPSPAKGLYEIVSGGNVYYMSDDGAYLFNGNVIDVHNQKNITEIKKTSLRLGMINSIPESDMLIYEASSKSDRSITVFTDTTCPFCSRLHAEIDILLDAGIRVRYLLFPRAGLGSQAHIELESVWCSNDPQEAMTVAKAGGSIDHQSCENPIESHISLAEKVGLRGTPLIYLDDGTAISGYRPAQQLVHAINASTQIDQK